jgi:hypothetical protein
VAFVSPGRSRLFLLCTVGTLNAHEQKPPPMITRDYFLRMIHQLAQVIAKVLGLSQLKQYDVALDEIQLSSKQLLGMDLRLLTTLSDEEFVRLLALGERFDVEKCVVAGELLRLTGEVKELEGTGRG